MFTNQTMIFPKGMINSLYRVCYSGLGGQMAYACVYRTNCVLYGFYRGNALMSLSRQNTPPQPD